MVQIQPVPIKKFSHVTGFFFVFIYRVLQGDTFLVGHFYIFLLFFYSGFLSVTASFYEVKKQRDFLDIHANIPQKSSPSLRMRDLLEILQQAFSSLDGFFRYT